MLNLVENPYKDTSKQNKKNEENKTKHELVYYRIIDPEINSNFDSWIEGNNCWICDRWHKIQIKYLLGSVNFTKDSQLSDRNYDTEEKTPELPKEKSLKKTEIAAKTISRILKTLLTIPKSKENNTLSHTNNKSKITSLSKPNDNQLKPGLEFKICGSFTHNKNEKMSYDCKTKEVIYFNYVPYGVHKYKILKINTLTQEIVTLTETEIAVKQRDTEIPQYRTKVPHNDKINLKKFNFSRSVFKDFRIDTKPIIDLCFEIDWKKVKITKFVNVADAPKIRKSVYDNYVLIKDIFIYRISRSKSYPTLGWQIFLDFCNEISVLDDKVTIIEIDKAFVAANMEDDDDSGDEDTGANPARELCRYEFIEILIRLAMYKYYTTKICQSYFDAWGTFYSLLCVNFS